MADGAELHVDVLGPVAIAVGGGALVVDTRKAVAVLAVLAIARSSGRGAVSRSELATLFWPDVDEGRARSSLRRTLSVLVAAAGAAVNADRSSVSLDPDLVTSDVISFRQLAVSPDRDDLARAVGLVRGDLLAGFALRDAPAFDDWVRRESDTLRRELGAVLERLVLARIRHNELHPGLADATRWLELDPLHEAAHRSVMRLLSWTGRRQDALEHYQRCIRVLGAELGVTPVPATTEVYEAIRSGTLRAPRNSVPEATRVPAGIGRPDPVPLIHRDAALRTLRTEAGHGDRLILITGEAGVGRSRLLEEFAAAVDDVLVVRAHGGETTLTYAPVADLLRAAIRLGRPLDADLAAEVSRVVPEILPPGHAPAPPLSTPGARDLFYDAVVRVLAGSGARAVVVDDVHAVSALSAEVLAYLTCRLDRLPGPLVLTWRDPGLPERHPVRRAINARSTTHRTMSIELQRLTRAEVAELAGPQADAIWRDTAGLPLLVAAALRVDGTDFPASIRDLFAARLDEVSEETSQVLAALAVLGGVAEPGNLPAASGRAETETVDAVEEAVRTGLVREEGSTIAFTHDMLRRVAYERMSLLRRRLLHRRAAATLAAEPDATLRAGAIAKHYHLGGNDDAAVTWAWRAAVRARDLYAHEDAFVQLEFAASLGRDDVDLAIARGEALVALARYEPAREAFRRALALATSDPERAAIERRQADVAARQGEWARAAAGLDAALELAADDDRLKSRLLADQAVVAVRAGRLSDAKSVTTHALAGAPELDAYLLNVAGIVALASTDGDQAIAHFEDALHTLTSVPDTVLHAAVLNNLASAQAMVGETATATATARAALELGALLGDRHRLAALHANLVDRLHESGDEEGAIEHLKQSAALFAEVGVNPLDRPAVWTLTVW